MTNTLHPEVLNLQTAHVLEMIGAHALSDGFYLCGGTALALHFGHRESEDLDFFSLKPFNPVDTQNIFRQYGDLKSTTLEENTFNTFFNGVKLQILGYPYPLLEPLLIWQGVAVSSVLDIACTKLVTVSMRGLKKDFVDIYFILKSYSLQFLLDSLTQKYATVQYNRPHILKSLLYFEDAEDQPMPRMFHDTSWETIKSKLAKCVKEL
jgi:hypothetical protein